MSWTTQETQTFGADTVLLQIGDQIVDLGHRLVVNGTPGDVAPLSSIAKSGDYRGTQSNFDLRDPAVLPRLFKADDGTGGGSFPAGPATVTVTAINITGTRDSAPTTFGIADGAGNVHSWSFFNNAGAGGNTTGIDWGGGPSDTVMAGRIKTRIDALSIAGLTVVNASGVLTISSTNGVVAYSRDVGVVVS